MEGKKLTEKEYEIMTLLWESSEPMSGSDIVKKAKERNLNIKSIYVMLSSLLDKEAISIAGFTKSKTNYGRTFIPNISQTDYVIGQIKRTVRSKNIRLSDLVSSMIDDVDVDIIDELEKIISEKGKMK